MVAPAIALLIAVRAPFKSTVPDPIVFVFLQSGRWGIDWRARCRGLVIGYGAQVGVQDRH